MFGTKRNSLVKRLWKYRLLPQNETGCETQTESSSNMDLEIKSTAQSMLKRLKEKQLEVLLRSVESKGGETTKCVLIPRGDKRLGKRTVSPEMLVCQIWRWPNIADRAELKQLPCCTPADDPLCVCCNPYHWSILFRPDPPSPSLSRPILERVAKNTVSGCQMEEESSHVVETETGLTPPPYQQYVTDGSTGQQRSHWCHIAYWEHQTRVGPLFTVFEPHIRVFQDLPHGDGMCLGILQKGAALASSMDESVRKTREKIGFGVTLSREADGVWIYNQSQHPVFVNSPTIGHPSSLLLYVSKVHPGYSLKIFDYDCSVLYEQIRNSQYRDGPLDSKSVRISFAKGWGSCYTRRFITSCPCWIELLLQTNR